MNQETVNSCSRAWIISRARSVRCVGCSTIELLGQVLAHGQPVCQNEEDSTVPPNNGPYTQERRRTIGLTPTSNLGVLNLLGALLSSPFKNASLVAAEVTRLTLAEGNVGQSEPPYVGCYFFNGLLAPVLSFRTTRTSPRSIKGVSTALTT